MRIIGRPLDKYEKVRYVLSQKLRETPRDEIAIRRLRKLLRKHKPRNKYAVGKVFKSQFGGYEHTGRGIVPQEVLERICQRQLRKRLDA